MTTKGSYKRCVVCGRQFYVRARQVGSAKWCSQECRRDVWQHVMPEPNTGCWIWTGAMGSAGYGVCSPATGEVCAHRRIYRLTKGDIPDGLQLDHKCRNRWCVNPDHLEPVTNKENGERVPRIIQARAATHCPSGHAWTPENTYRRANGARRCRACALETNRRGHQERKSTNV